MNVGSQSQKFLLKKEFKKSRFRVKHSYWKNYYVWFWVYLDCLRHPSRAAGNKWTISVHPDHSLMIYLQSILCWRDQSHPSLTTSDSSQHASPSSACVPSSSSPNIAAANVKQPTAVFSYYGWTSTATASRSLTSTYETYSQLEPEECEREPETHGHSKPNVQQNSFFYLFF